MLKFLDCFKDSDEWDGLLSTKDPHFSPAFYQAFGGGKLAVFDRNTYQPFHHQEGNWIGNAYNFGGILGTCENVHRFTAEFDEWKTQKGLNERCTLSLFDYHCVEKMHRTITSKSSVVVDLAAPPYLRQTTKHSIAKATEAGIYTQVVDSTVANASLFEDIYLESMRRKEAASHWRYLSGFFYSVLRELGPNRSSLVLSGYKGRTESGCFLIFDEKTCYYHWAARKADAPSVGVDAYQVWNVIGWARQRGCRWLCLGGGLTEGDSLFSFKSGFSKLFFTTRSYITEAGSA